MAGKFKLKPQLGYIRAPLFALVVLCFFLPFILVSCPENNSSRSITGIELAVTGKTIPGSAFSAFTNNQRFNAKEFGTAALAAAIAGIICSFLKKKSSFILCIAASIAGILFLILLRNQIAIDARARAADKLVIGYLQGYWLALTAFIVAGFATLIIYFSDRIKLAIPFLKKRSKSGANTRKVKPGRTVKKSTRKRK
ncbi:MAG: hypothetical protein JW904_04630 [Spirochaetales bacterium]|nr:hypothetical protein [Spirochaetales bacterium]